MLEKTCMLCITVMCIMVTILLAILIIGLFGIIIDDIKYWFKFRK